MTDATPSETRETPVAPAHGRKPVREANPVRIFVDKDRLAFCWFLIAVVAVGCAIFAPLFLVQKLKERERVIVIDPAHTYYISPLLSFAEANELHIQQTTLAATAFLDRNPVGFDQPELLKRMLLKAAYYKALELQKRESPEFKAKELHQKAEVGQISILQTRQDSVLTQVTGQLIRTGIFQEKAFSEAIPFKLSFKMVRNPDMTQNGRFPTAVLDYKYEPTR
ncbi:MAG: hypothetical protein ABI680_00270 [Chthoniobacteraceae bacterium]